MDGITFSIIVPVYQVAAYLPKCVESILAQTFTDFELLLIDDGSFDQSGVLCDSYALTDSRVRVFHKPNGGVGSARNRGLDEARGEWITFVDSDDWLAPDFLEQMWNQAVQHQADAVFCNCFYVQGDECVPKQIYKENAVEDGSGILKRLLIKFGMRSELWGKIIKRNFLEKQRLRTDIKIGEDLLYLIELYYYHDCKTVICKEPLYYYRQVNTSAMNTNNLIENNRKLLMNHLQFMAVHPDIERNFPRENAIFVVRLASSIIKRDFTNQSKDIFIRNLLEKNYTNAVAGLLRSEKRFLRWLFIHPRLGALALQIERIVTKLYFNRQTK
jgi:glycosyltransferase involved in cell wall biosynthesis